MKIGLIGTFDTPNFGDCLFPEVYEFELSKRLPDLEFQMLSPTSNAAQILSDHSVTALPDRLEEVDDLSCDAYILTGGETISIGHSAGTYISRRSTLSPALRLWLPPLVAASRLDGPRFFIHSAGISPSIPNADESAIFPLISGADGVLFRGEYSLERFVRAGGSATLSVDPVFCVSELEHSHEWLARAKRFVPEDWISGGYLVAQVSPGYIRRDFMEWCNEIAQMAKANEWNVVLLPLCYFLHDQMLLRSAQGILRKRDIRAHLIAGKLNVRDTVGVVAGAAAYCGSSLHGAVVSVSFAKPVALLSSGERSKHLEVMRSVGLDDVTTTSVDGLGSCMARSMRYDMNRVRNHAISLAAEGVDMLSRQLAADRVGRPTVSQDSLQNVLALDHAPAKGVRQAIKRTILRATKNTKLFGPTYFYLRHWLRQRYWVVRK